MTLPRKRGRQEGERIQELDLSIGHDQQHGLGIREPSLDFGDDVPRINRECDAAAAGACAFLQRIDGALPRFVAARNAIPRGRRATDSHHRAGDKRR